MNIDNLTRLVKSPHLVVIKHGLGYVVYHSLLGCPTVINASGFRVLNLFRKPHCLMDVKKRYEVQGLNHWLQAFVGQRFLIREGTNERAILERAVDKVIRRIARGKQLASLGLILDESCNFNCSYCVSRKLIQVSKRSSPKSKRMSWVVAQHAIDTFVTLARKQGRQKLEVYLGGGEPLLNWRVFQRAIEYCKSKYGNEFKFHFSTNTNASLIDAGRAAFLAHHQVTVTSSLDGPKSANDMIRKLHSGKGTFTRIVSGWNHLGIKGRYVKWFCLTLTDQNIESINEEFFDFLASRRIVSCSFEPDLICSLTHTPKQVVAALLCFKKWGESRNISVGGLWCKPFKNLFSTNRRPNFFNCSAFTGRGISVLPSGEIVPCSYSATKLGTIDDLDVIFQTKQFQAFTATRAVGNIEACHGCEIEGQCMGGCYLTTEYGSHTGSQSAFTYRCEIYKRATRSLLLASV